MRFLRLELLYIVLAEVAQAEIVRLFDDRGWKRLRDGHELHAFTRARGAAASLRDTAFHLGHAILHRREPLVEVNGHLETYNSGRMPSGAHQSERHSPDEAYAAIRLFLDTSREPALLEPGQLPIGLSQGNHEIRLVNGRLTIQAWDRERNFIRRVTGILSQKNGVLDLETELFGKKSGKMQLLDLAGPHSRTATRKGERQSFREVFRRLLKRQFPSYTVEEMSAEPNLQHSLSAGYPRATLSVGPTIYAAIAAPPSANADGLLAYALLWFDYLRRREQKRVVEGLLIWIPEGQERTTLLRLKYIDAPVQVFCYTEEHLVRRADPLDIGNHDTRLPPAAEDPAIRVNGLEVARHTPEGLICTFDGVRDATSERELESLVREVQRRRRPLGDPQHPLYARAPEAWLESQVRRHLELVDSSLQPSPLYGQVPAISGIERGVLDLLCVDLHGRLAVLELKASEDLQMPVQALDYWMRVKWHLENGDLVAMGFFPDTVLRQSPPRLFLVAPSLEFHPAVETILRYFSRRIQVERIGLAMNWREEIRVVFRMKD